MTTGPGMRKQDVVTDHSSVCWRSQPFYFGDVLEQIVNITGRNIDPRRWTPVASLSGFRTKWTLERDTGDSLGQRKCGPRSRARTTRDITGGL